MSFHVSFISADGELPSGCDAGIGGTVQGIESIHFVDERVELESEGFRYFKRCHDSTYLVYIPLFEVCDRSRGRMQVDRLYRKGAQAVEDALLRVRSSER